MNLTEFLAAGLCIAQAQSAKRTNSVDAEANRSDPPRNFAGEVKLSLSYIVLCFAAFPFITVVALMAVTELIDEHVSTKQCDLAVNALLKHAQKAQEKMQDSELLGGREQHVWLVVTVKKMQQEKKLKPRRMYASVLFSDVGLCSGMIFSYRPIVHPLVDPRTSPICLITKDPQREYKNLLEENKIRFISRVVGISKLKGKFKPFEARRLLLKENGLFLADERVIPLLPGLLGKKFFDAKKYANH